MNRLQEAEHKWEKRKATFYLISFIIVLLTILASQVKADHSITYPVNNSHIVADNNATVTLVSVNGAGGTSTFDFVNNSNNIAWCTNLSVDPFATVRCTINVRKDDDIQWYVNETFGGSTETVGVSNFSVKYVHINQLNLSLDNGFNNTNTTFTPVLDADGCFYNTTYWNSTQAPGKQIAGFDFNVNSSNQWDYTGNNFNVTCTNNATWSNGVINFRNSSNVVQCKNVAYSASTFDKNTTFSMFVKINNNNSGGNAIILQQNVDNNNRFAIVFRPNNRIQAAQYNGSFSYSRSSLTLNYDEWYHVVAIQAYNNGIRNISLYINNSLQTISDSFTGLDTGSNFLALSGNVFSNSFNGSIDNVRIYNYSLSPTEISELYNSTKENRTLRLLPSQTTTGDYWQANAVCANPNTNSYSPVVNKVVHIEDCVEVLANTSSTWLNTSTCSIYDLVPQNYTYITYDSNQCGYTANQTTTLNQNISCNFCSSGNQNLSLCNPSEVREIKMTPIAILLIGLIFWLIYTASTFNTNDDKGKAIFINGMLKTILYAFAGFAAFLAIQVMYGFSIDLGAGAGVVTTLRTLYTLAITIGVILLFLLLYGIFGNMAVSIITYFQKRFDRRKE